MPLHGGSRIILSNELGWYGGFSFSEGSPEIVSKKE